MAPEICPFSVSGANHATRKHKHSTVTVIHPSSTAHRTVWRRWRAVGRIPRRETDPIGAHQAPSSTSSLLTLSACTRALAGPKAAARGSCSAPSPPYALLTTNGQPVRGTHVTARTANAQSQIPSPILHTPFVVLCISSRGTGGTTLAHLRCAAGTLEKQSDPNTLDYQRIGTVTHY